MVIEIGARLAWVIGTVAVAWMVASFVQAWT